MAPRFASERFRVSSAFRSSKIPTNRYAELGSSAKVTHASPLSGSTPAAAAASGLRGSNPISVWARTMASSTPSVATTRSRIAVSLPMRLKKRSNEKAIPAWGGMAIRGLRRATSTVKVAVRSPWESVTVSVTRKVPARPQAWVI